MRYAFTSFRRPSSRLISHPLALLLFTFFLTITFASPAHAATSARREHVTVRVTTPQESVGPSGNVLVAVHYRIDPHWHIYWKNPGDSGAAPKFTPTGGTLEKIDWPYPVRLPISDLTNYGYEGETALLLQLHTTPDTRELQLKLEWLVCQEECLPGFAELTLPLSHGAHEVLKPDTDADKILYDRFRQLVPTTDAGWHARTLRSTAGHFDFELLAPTGRNVAELLEVFVFPEDGETFLTTAPALESTPTALQISVPVSPNAPAITHASAFTLVARTETSVQSFRIEVPPPSASEGLLRAILFAFLGGLILNLMPCVFPILSLKVFSFLKETNRRENRRSSWSYGAGVVVTFAAIGGLLTALRLSGEAVGWGYQLQNPWLVFLLSLLFFAMALNFLGVFELGENLANVAGRAGAAKFFSGSFGTGILAVIVASPCTAPFMGSALGVTLLLPWQLSLLVFIALGLGMALPMVLLSYAPRLIAWLPRSGAWMEHFKQALAFPMFATSLWLLWVLGVQRGLAGVFAALATWLTFALGVWLRGRFRGGARALALLLLLGSPVYGVWLIRNLPEAAGGAATPDHASAWHPFDAKTLVEKTSSGPVFVDFTASWCITCQVNKRGVLETEEIQNAFRAHNVYLMRADWTNQHPEITAALASFDRNSVPLYVFYSGKERQILPQILTKKMILELFEAKEILK